jgi:YjbE family integral membrane protein
MFQTSIGFQTGIGDLGDAAFWFSALQIVFINLVLSGDNAVVIAMACRGLPPHQRFRGLVIGAGVSAILLVIFAVIVTRLMSLPYLKLVGGLVLLYISAKLLVPDRADRNEIEAAAHLWSAVRLVVVADIIMSLDNIIAVVAIARGNLALLAVGLAVSIPVVVVGAALIMMLLRRAPILVWAGAALLGWVAGEVIASDPVVSDRVTAAFGGASVGASELVAATAAATLVIAAGGLWRRMRLFKSNADAVSKQTGDE